MSILRKKLDLKKVYEEFELNVETDALYQPNAKEFYQKAFAEINMDDLRLIPGVKGEEKIGNLSIGGTVSVLGEFDCGFPDPQTLDLDAKKIEVSKISTALSICQSDLEESFARLEMTDGQEGWKTASQFWAEVNNIVAKRVGEDLATAKWQGQSGVGLATITGLEDRITSSGDTTEVTFADPTYTVANVESAFEDLLVALPDSIARSKNELRFYVSPSVKNAIMISLGKNNTSFYLTQELQPTYVGIKIVEEPGMSGDMIALTRKDNIVVGVDALNDMNNIKVRDLDVINEPVIRLRADFNFGTLILNDEEIFYTLAE